MVISCVLYCRGFKKADCAISRVYSYFEDGKKSDESKFLGLNGYEAVIEVFKNEMSSIKAMENQISDVDSQVAAVQSAILSFSTKFSTATVQSAKDPEYIMYTDTTRKMHPNTISREIGNELKSLYDAATTVYQFGVSSERISQKERNDYDVAGIEFHLLLSYAKIGFNKLKEFTKNYRYNVRGPVLKFFIWVIMISLSLLTIIFLVATCYSFKVRKHIKKSMFCQVLITIYFFLVASSFNILAVVGFGFGTIGTNICSYSLDMIDKANYSRAAVPEYLHPLVDRCVYEKGNGDITSVSSAFKNGIGYQDLFNIFNGLGLKSQNYNITSNGKSKPLPSLLEFKEHLIKLKKLEEYDFDEPNSVGKGYRDIIPKINAIIKCAKDEIQVDERNCTTPAIISKLTDAVDANLDENYCIVLTKFDHNNLKERYATKPCAAEAIPLYPPLKRQVDQFFILVDEMIAFYDDEIKPDYDLAVEKLEKTMPEVEKASVQAPNTAKFFSEKGYSYSEISDCRFIRPYLVTTWGNFCFELVINFAYQTRYLVTLGPLITFFATCLCCAVIQTRSKVVEGDEFLVKGMVRPAGFGVDVDDAPKGWATSKQNLGMEDKTEKIEMDFDGFAHLDEEENKPMSRKNSNKRKEKMG